MTTISIRKKLMGFIAGANEKKIKGMYLLLGDEIEKEEWEYTKEFKSKLDRQFRYYKNGGKMISSAEAKKQIRNLLKKSK